MEENKDDGNGKIAPNKTPEQLAQERLERYTKDPETFVEISELILAAIRNPKSQLGISVFVAHCKRTELNQAETELAHICHKQRLQMDIASEMVHQAQKNLITPGKGGIFNFARHKK